PLMELDHGGAGQRPRRSIPVNSLPYRPPARASQVSLSDQFVGMKESCRTQNSEIMQGEDRRYACSEASVQNRGAEKRKKIMDVHHIRQICRYFLRESASHAGAVDHSKSC